MKSTFFTLFLLIGLAGSAVAQSKPTMLAELPGSDQPDEARIEEMTRLMAKTLNLNEGQYVRMRNINRVKVVRLDEIQWQYREDTALQHNKVLELQSQYEAECSRILSPTQLSILRSEQQKDQLPKADPTMGGVG